MAGVVALLVAALFLLGDTTAVDITHAAGWALALAVVGLAGVLLAARRWRAQQPEQDDSER